MTAAALTHRTLFTMGRIAPKTATIPFPVRLTVDHGGGVSPARHADSARRPGAAEGGRVMLDYTVRPIDVWPGKRTPSYQRKRAPFKGTWSRTLAELDRELRHLGARTVIFRLDVEERHLRQDGQLRADARPKDSGVLLEFVAGARTGAPRLVFRCDRFAYWQDNLLAIALGLEALRKVDRYGITDASDQYAGFKALPSSTAPTMTVGAAAQVIAENSSAPAGEIERDAGTAKDAVRTAIHRTHPDRNNGERAAFDRVDTARKVLSSHHGVSL